MSKRVIELVRVSTERQAAEDRASLPAQRAANRRTAQAYGLEIVRSIEYSDVSGAAVLAAPEIQEMVELIASPEIHGVVAREFSRLIRPESFLDFALLQAFADTNTLLYLPEGPIDFSSKSGRLMGTIRAAIAGMERSEILERVWSAKEEKRRQGKFGQSAVCLPSDVGYSEERGWYYKPEAEKMREAFRLFLSGDTSYSSVGAKVGLDPYTLRVKLRNPIYTGWRVIDKRRDPSPGARRVKAGGRQGDRRKIRRAPEDVIRVRVIAEPLVSVEDFDRLQLILDAKAARHWRTRSDYQHRYTYNGFLTCSSCGGLVYTHFRRADYYVCKSRKARGACKTSYMRRDRVDPYLDSLFSERLTDRGFLADITESLRAKADGLADTRRAERLSDELDALKGRRERVLDAYFEGVVGPEERDSRLAKIDGDIRVTREMLARERPAPELSLETLTSVFSVFFEFEFLGREDKRRLLSTMAPDIRIADYKVHGISVLLPPARGDERSRTGTGSSPPRA